MSRGQLFYRIQILSLPFLMGVYPLSFLYYHNVKEVSYYQTLLPLFATLLFSGIIFLLSRLILKNTVKASLAASIIVFISLNYGQIGSYLTMRNRFLMPILFFVGLYLGYFIYCAKNEETLKKSSRLISTLLFLLIILNVGQALPYELNKKNVTDKVEKIVENVGVDQTPDIYYIVLDEYASLQTIKNVYNYNNDGFATNLENSGFYVARNSKTRSASSEVSMATTLNMRFIRSKNGDLTANGFTGKEDKVFDLMTNNEVKRYLTNKGYKYVFIGSWAELSRWKVEADIYYNYYKNDNVKALDDFSSVFINTTILKPFNYLFNINYDSSNHIRNSALFAFDSLKKTTEIDGPKFVFAHILLPHTPFVFGQNGEEVDSSNSYNWIDKKYYLDQYIYTTKQIEKVISEILKNSKTQPIIVLQSDHGPRANDEFNGKLVIPSKEKAKILNAFYLPGIDQEKVLYDNISPANSFRVVFNNYFGEKYELLEDEFVVKND